ncbi:MAG: aminofutalosine synthase MqnE [Deltaproteobacteria bacterium]|nr:MAG: aminofutalosine synthase MqnE [Deltaproteobacteria bacterium]
MTNWSIFTKEIRISSKLINDPELIAIKEKIEHGKRLDKADGLACLKTHDLLGLGQLANAIRHAHYGKQTSYIVNHHINYTNVCSNACRFCAFYRAPGADGAYTLKIEDILKSIRSASLAGLQEVHVVGGCNPELDLSYYLDMFKTIGSWNGQVKIKALTAVEVDQIAKKQSMSSLEVLETLRNAGLAAMPGGGAEVFSARLHKILFPKKADAETWLRIHGEAHSLGIKTNATMLIGHLETLEERVVHFTRLREQQDRSGGFQAFILLPFHPSNTPLDYLRGPSGPDILKTLATARLMLDNIPHMKAYWVMLGTKLAEIALHYGADDFEGTIVNEHIAHEAGARTAKGLTEDELASLIKEAGVVPVERDTDHNVGG